MPANKSAPSIVVDLDETLLWREGGIVERARLYLGHNALVGQPYPKAHSALADLSMLYRVVAVTARNRLAERNTLHWLRHHGFGYIPVVHSASVFPNDSDRDGYKSAAIRSLSSEGWSPCVAGIGDRPSDLLAYAAVGMHCIMVVHAPPDGDSSRTLSAFSLLRAAASTLPINGGPYRITYVTDSQAVMEAAEADPALVGAMHVPKVPNAPSATSALPPVWEQVRDLLMDEAAVRGLTGIGTGSPSPAAKECAADWEEEATASWYVAGRPKDYGK